MSIMNLHIPPILTQITQQQDMSTIQMRQLVEAFMSGSVSEVQIAACLAGLRTKGENVEEYTGAIEAMRGSMHTIPSQPGTIDMCGTGGDGIGTFNISTATAFVVAGCGVPVAKHGGKAASSKCGSADVLQALGVDIMMSPEKAEQTLTEVGMVFLFAPVYHPSMKHVAPVRKELGIRTIFNSLGPFCNPAQVTRQMIGVPDKQTADMLAQVAERLGYDYLLIVTNAEGMDEIGIASPTYVHEVKRTKGKIEKKEFIINPQKLGIKKAPLERLKGGSVQENARILKDILAGKKGPRRDIIVLNSAYALVVAGKATTAEEGIAMAGESLDSGEAERRLAQLITFSQEYV